MSGPFGRRGEPGEPDPADWPASGAPAEADPPAPAPAPEPPGPTSPIPWIVGVLAVAILGYITLNTIRTEGASSTGVANGDPLPPFAAPLADGPAGKDANVHSKAADGVPAACDVHLRGVLNVCDEARDAPVVLVFTAHRSRQCLEQVDIVDRVSRRHPDVTFAAVAIKADQGIARRLAAERGWRLPVAYDQDGAVSMAYGVAVCPLITFAKQGGKVWHTALGAVSEPEVERRVREITG